MKRSQTYRLRPTIFGCVLGIVLVLLAIIRPSVADPSVTGLVWAGVLAAWIIGMLWPLLSLQRIVVVVNENPADIQVGNVGLINVTVEGYGLGVSIHVTGMETVYSDVTLPAELDLPIVVSQRGQFQRVQLEISTDAPFGILWVTRRVVVALPVPMVVGPAAIAHQVQPEAVMRGEEQLATNSHNPLSDTIRSVRPYMSGDPFHFVDWKSTARRGEVIIKEFDPPAQQAICLVLQLRPIGNSDTDHEDQPDSPLTSLPRSHGSDPQTGDPTTSNAAMIAQQERHVSEIFGATSHALGAGMRVVLCTWEASGGSLQQRSQEIEHPLMAQRQLAVAVPGPGGRAPVDHIPEGWALQMVGSSHE